MQKPCHGENGRSTMSEVDEFVGLGFEAYLIGGLEVSRELPLEESLLFSVKNLNRMRKKNLFPIVLFDSKTKKKKVITHG